jgi:hypothetical protein
MERMGFLANQRYRRLQEENSAGCPLKTKWLMKKLNIVI